MEFSNEYEMAVTLGEIRDSLKEIEDKLSMLDTSVSMGLGDVVEAIKESE